MHRQRHNEDYQPTRTPGSSTPTGNPVPPKSRHKVPDYAEQREDYPDEDDRR